MEIAKYIVVVLYVIVCVALIILATIQNKDEKQIIYLLNSKQTVGKQMHQTLLTFKHNYTEAD